MRQREDPQAAFASLLLAVLFFLVSGLAPTRAMAEEFFTSYYSRIEHPAIGLGIHPRQQVAALNVQPFAGALGGAEAPAILQSSDPERPFEVDGDTFPDFQSAADRACDNQKNLCADQANSQDQEGENFEVGDCDNQNNQCKQTASSTELAAFPQFLKTEGDFNIFCE